MNLLMCLAHSPGGTTRGAKKALRVRRPRRFVPSPGETRHQREEEHLRVLILSSLESPLLVQRAGEIRSYTFRGITNFDRLNR